VLEKYLKEVIFEEEGYDQKDVDIQQNKFATRIK